VRNFLTALLLLAASFAAAFADLPQKPADYVFDAAGLLAPAQREALVRKLEQYERETSNQLLVVTMPRVPEEFAMEDFTQRTVEAWGVGQKDEDNGMVLFIFPESRETRIEVGYGLEGAVPDALANGIIQAEMIPLFRSGDMAGGILRGADALMAAARGEYQGRGRTIAESSTESPMSIPIIWFLVLIFIFIAIQNFRNRGGALYSPSGRSSGWGSSGSGGGGFSSGGGGFSGGGGSFGGGGASGRW
jgi:uncharacterized protein